MKPRTQGVIFSEGGSLREQDNPEDPLELVFKLWIAVLLTVLEHGEGCTPGAIRESVSLKQRKKASPAASTARCIACALWLDLNRANGWELGIAWLQLIYRAQPHIIRLWARRGEGMLGGPHRLRALLETRVSAMARTLSSPALHEAIAAGWLGRGTRSRRPWRAAARLLSLATTPLPVGDPEPRGPRT